MNPLVGLQGGLMGIAPPQTAAVQQPPATGLMNYQPGYWSQQAYKMAGSPIQGPYAPVPVPAATGVDAAGAGGGGSGIGGTALGLLSVLAKNPSLVKSGYNAISGLLGGGAAAGAPALSAVGTGAVAPAVDSAAASASAALGGTDAAAGGAAGGLLGAGTGAAAGTGAIGSAGASALGASGGFATGGAAGAGGGAASGSLGAAGTAALVAAPFIAQQAVLALGDAWTKKNTQGNTAMKAWMNATGSKWVPNAGQSNSGGSTFQSQQFGSASNPGTMYGPDGKAMTPTQAVNALYQWATQNGVNPGDFHPVG